MDDQTKIAWYSRIYHALPKWARIIVLALSIITIVWWAGFVLYKILCAIRVFGSFVFDKRNYWTFLVCLLILGIGSLLIAQFYLGLNPFGKMAQWFIERWNDFRSALGNKIINS